MELRMSVVILVLIWSGCESFPVADNFNREGGGDTNFEIIYRVKFLEIGRS